MNSDIVNALSAVLVALLTLGGSLIGWIAYLLALRLRAKVSVDQWNLAETFIVRAVQAAEQYGVLGVIENSGKSKKEAVLSAVQAYFDAHNIKLNAEQIDILIEAAITRGINEKFSIFTTTTVGASSTLQAPSDTTTTVST